MQVVSVGTLLQLLKGTVSISDLFCTNDWSKWSIGKSSARLFLSRASLVDRFLDLQVGQLKCLLSASFCVLPMCSCKQALQNVCKHGRTRGSLNNSEHKEQVNFVFNVSNVVIFRVKSSGTNKIFYLKQTICYKQQCDLTSFYYGKTVIVNNYSAIIITPQLIAILQSLPKIVF